MNPESCLHDPDIQAAFERSNIEQSQREHNARQLDFLFAQGSIQPRDIEELSSVEAYRKPDGSSMGSETHLLALLFPGVILSREAGLFKKRTELQEFPYSEFSGSFVPEEKEFGRGWGECAIQAAVGSLPVFRLGWHWSTGRDRDRELVAVAAERDRILALMQRDLESASQA